MPVGCSHTLKLIPLQTRCFNGKCANYILSQRRGSSHVCEPNLGQIPDFGASQPDRCLS